MGLIDFLLNLGDLLLNLGGLLLWLNWRSLAFDPFAKTTPTTLAGTVRRADASRPKGWRFLASLAALVFCRTWLYWQLGAALNWTPQLRLGAIVLAFRSDLFARMLIFSALSFALVLAMFYLCLLLFSLLNGRTAEADPLLKLVRLHLGLVDRWPWPVKLLLPLVSAVPLWFILSWPLARLNIIDPAPPGVRVEQAVVLGLGAYLAWKFPLGILLALYVLVTYVYLGKHNCWDFINQTARNLLAPLRRLPLHLGKFDFAPLLVLVTVFVAAQYAERGLTLLYARLPL